MKKNRIDPELDEILQEIEEKNAWPVLVFMLAFVLLLSIGIVEIIVWFICMITGVKFSFLLGLAGWVFFIVVRWLTISHKK